MIVPVLPTWAVLALGLFVMHFFWDYQFQADTVAQGKNPGLSPFKTVPWYYWLLSHCSCQALGVFLVLWSPFLALLEMVCHFAIDWLKCNRYYGVHTDQALHLLCKVVWLVLFFQGVR